MLATLSRWRPRVQIPSGPQQNGPHPTRMRAVLRFPRRRPARRTGAHAVRARLAFPATRPESRLLPPRHHPVPERVSVPRSVSPWRRDPWPGTARGSAPPPRPSPGGSAAAYGPFRRLGVRIRSDGAVGAHRRTRRGPEVPPSGDPRSRRHLPCHGRLVTERRTIRPLPQRQVELQPLRRVTGVTVQVSRSGELTPALQLVHLICAIAPPFRTPQRRPQGLCAEHPSEPMKAPRKGAGGHGGADDGPRRREARERAHKKDRAGPGGVQRDR